MTDADFASFVASQQVTPAHPALDWDKERDQYTRDVTQLYERVVTYLSDFINDGSIKISRDEVELTEENIGTYRIPRLLVAIGRQTVFFEPVGTLLIGSKGRVDVIGPVKRTPILLINATVRYASDLIKVNVSIAGSKKEPPPKPQPTAPDSWIWKIRSKQRPSLFEDLDKENLFSLILEVSQR